MIKREISGDFDDVVGCWRCVVLIFLHNVWSFFNFAEIFYDDGVYWREYSVICVGYLDSYGVVFGGGK